MTWGTNLPDRFLLCRDLGHTWRPFTAAIVDGNTYQRTMRCGRCRTERSQTVSASGHILSGKYAYEDGYLAPAGTGRLDSVDRDGLRLESILRVISKEDDR